MAKGQPLNHMSWEDTFTTWSKGPGTTEQQKCENAESVISRILKADRRLANIPFRVFTQGSYRARTNVRQDSDVDICVLHTNAFFHQLAPGAVDPTSHLPSAEPSFPDFKMLVHAALAAELGALGVTRGNKAIDVHANSYRIDADVVPAFEHRYYYNAGTHATGIEFRPDSGGRVINWPEQTRANGIAKHERTARQYKRAIRILKRLRNKMQDENIATAHDIASFLIECLVWNAPDSAFNHNTYTAVIRDVLMHTFNNTINDADCQEWGEVNEIKYLFRPSQPWTREQAHKFLSAAWDYIGFG
jgi:hypothetical protein